MGSQVEEQWGRKGREGVEGAGPQPRGPVSHPQTSTLADITWSQRAWVQILLVSSAAVGPGQEGFPPPREPQVLCAPPGGHEDEGGASAWALATTGDLGTEQRLSKTIGMWRVAGGRGAGALYDMGMGVD